MPTDSRRKRQTLLRRMVREAKKQTAPEGAYYLEQYCVLVLTGKLIACQKIKLLCAILLDKIRHPEKYSPYVF